MSFTEASTVENLVRDLLCGSVTHHTAAGAGLARKSGKLAGLGWHYLAPSNIPRLPHEILVEEWGLARASRALETLQRGNYA